MLGEEKQEQLRQDIKDAAEYRLFLKKIKDTFGTRHGKDVLRWILEKGGMWNPLFVSSSDVYKRTGIHDFCGEIVNEVMAADISIYFDIVQQRVDEIKIPDNDNN
jgi:hypothetical protein